VVVVMMMGVVKMIVVKLSLVLLLVVSSIVGAVCRTSPVKSGVINILQTSGRTRWIIDISSVCYVPSQGMRNG